ncbi:MULTISPECIES: DegT/DnrJ/EryC1/StrS family aminotransferase [Jonquetella]|uniref:Putative PLP-dependent enzyme possibly involved in cell wall biogenesis n=1 Tax=Jonquetella anthropi DSM 22815 TaxID=885272 RepID=H0ULC2_9BACT|nr:MULTISPECIES: DegT/DnrJ/EryC1/StrS family aminotransferase [Jonquetella]EEX48043.1 DegT/DnrJ/EryC1/StrS aminotransferase family protein [Jonquetella anthropi E3_33 E1]EHM13481.1 putative PLP-dependent enzyme possibly involved in cell wall biogenesis [Jonquetella anthropi DSM 22815]ERL24405.1 putative spore coat polysaccharide biosynthesis protein SpsC [Jonquetella sp. BV3C21]
MTQRAFLPFALPDIGQSEIDEVLDSLKSGWLTTGPKTQRFEKDFAQYLGGGVHAMAVNSATAGLHLALEACGVGPGDEVITTSYTFTSSAEVARYLGAEPVLVDVLPDSLEIDLAAIERAISPKTKVIIPVHLAGLACDMKPLLELAHRHGIKVVEDAAHCFPVKYRGDFIGTLDSDCTVFSFYATKTMTTGEGGMIVTKDAEIAKRCRCMRLHGIDRDAFDRYTSERPAWYYEIVAPGFKYNMTDIAASIGIHQLERAKGFMSRRSAIAQKYLQAFADLPVQLPMGPTPEREHSWHLFMLRLSDDAPICRDNFIQEMSNAKIGCSVHYIPLHAQPYWKQRYNLQPQDFPVAEDAWKREVSLPIFTAMKDSDVDYVIEQVRRLLSR